MKIVKLSSLLLSIVVVAACGGGGSSTTTQGGNNPRAAVYRATYATGDMIVEINGAGVATVAVNDNASGTFTGTGSVNNVGVLSATASKLSPAGTILIAGTIVGSGVGATFGGNLSGAKTGTFNGGYLSPLDSNPFAGRYSGTFSGTFGGTWDATVGNDGRITATANDGVGTYTLNGNLNNVGTGQISGVGTGGGVTLVFAGQFKFGTGSVRNANGTWSSSAPGTGTWTGTLLQLR